MLDSCDIADGTSNDCNANDIPDECEGDFGPPITEQPADAEVEAGGFVIFHVQADGPLLEYQWRKDGVGLTDTDRIIGTASSTLLIIEVQPLDAGDYDCVVSEILDGGFTTSDAATLTVITTCPADFDGDGAVSPFDLALLLGAWGPCEGCPADLDGDGEVGPFDLALLLGNWGLCL